MPGYFGYLTPEKIFHGLAEDDLSAPSSEKRRLQHNKPAYVVILHFCVLIIVRPQLINCRLSMSAILPKGDSVLEIPSTAANDPKRTIKI
jgi:hypothetical protein